MMSKIPVALGRVGRKKRDMEIMRTAIVAELDAISLYEQLAAQTDNLDIKKVLSDVAREEKTQRAR